MVRIKRRDGKMLGSKSVCFVQALTHRHNTTVPHPSISLSSSFFKSSVSRGFVWNTFRTGVAAGPHNSQVSFQERSRTSHCKFLYSFWQPAWVAWKAVYLQKYMTLFEFLSTTTLKLQACRQRCRHSKHFGNLIYAFCDVRHHFLQKVSLETRSLILTGEHIDFLHVVWHNVAPRRKDNGFCRRIRVRHGRKE